MIASCSHNDSHLHYPSRGCIMFSTFSKLRLAISAIATETRVTLWRFSTGEKRR
jgi:hypothetical protein